MFMDVHKNTWDMGKSNGKVENCRPIVQKDIGHSGSRVGDHTHQESLGIQVPSQKVLGPSKPT